LSSITKQNDVFEKMTAVEEEKLSFYKLSSQVKNDGDYHFLVG
jgi:hypothetical protein